MLLSAVSGLLLSFIAYIIFNNLRFFSGNRLNKGVCRIFYIEVIRVTLKIIFNIGVQSMKLFLIDFLSINVFEFPYLNLVI